MVIGNEINNITLDGIVEISIEFNEPHICKRLLLQNHFDCHNQ